MSGMSPTERALKQLRKEGYTCAIVEKFVRFPFPGHRVDLFGIIDLLAMKEGLTGLLGVQVTSASNMSARMKKALANKYLPLWKATGNRFEVWSFGKYGKRGEVKRWDVRIKQF
jgi:hypothetical protein